MDQNTCFTKYYLAIKVKQTNLGISTHLFEYKEQTSS